MSDSISVSALECEERGEEVFDLIFRVLGERGHRRLPKSMALRETGENQVMVSVETPEWIVAVYPRGFGDGFACTAALSERFECRAFDFEVQASTWWYNFFVEGEVRDIFWQHPWHFHGEHETVTDEVLQARRGAPAVIADEFFGVPLGLLEPYFAQIDDGDLMALKAQDQAAYAKAYTERLAALSGKAHPEDVYPLSSPWVFTDFAAKLGMLYPVEIRTHEGLRFFAIRPAAASPAE